jgi:hypothetical protein
VGRIGSFAWQLLAKNENDILFISSPKKKSVPSLTCAARLLLAFDCSGTTAC